MKQLLLLMLLMIPLASCKTNGQHPTNANTNAMAVEQKGDSVPAITPGDIAITGVSYNKLLGDTVYVKESSGGDTRVEVTWLPNDLDRDAVRLRNVDFTAALEQSLVNCGFFKKTSTRWTEDWTIVPNILVLEKPENKKALRAYIKVNYKLYYKKQLKLDITIEKASLVKTNELTARNNVYRIALEECARENIAEFMKAMSLLK